MNNNKLAHARRRAPLRALTRPMSIVRSVENPCGYPAPEDAGGSQCLMQMMREVRLIDY